MAVTLSVHPPLGDDLQHCRRCDLWRHATTAVPGEGEPHAALMLVGEQPDKEEDRRGRPFIGPAGRLLDEAILDAGMQRGELYLTNAVKHYKWERRGKFRLHNRPSLAEIAACNVWLNREIAEVRPLVIIALGATALRSLTNCSITVDLARYQRLRHAQGPEIVATYHPTSILRAQGARADEMRAALVRDLQHARLRSEEAAA